MRFEISERAYADLDSITTWFEARSPDYGRDLISRLWQTIDYIAEDPTATPMVRHQRRGLRGYVVYPYVIYYRIAGETVLIERIQHGRQRRPRLP